MAIPDYETLMLPVLELVGDGITRIRDIKAAVCDRFELTEAERTQLLPSGQTRVISGRVGWAKTYLKKAGLVDNPAWGIVTITDEGRRVLASKPSRIDAELLKQFESFRVFIAPPRDTKTEDLPPTAVESVLAQKTPDDTLAEAHRQINEALADDLLDRLKTGSPTYFEKVVIDLLLAMGYGGSRAEAGKHVGQSGDEGIDGVIDEDRLGLDKIVIQAKRYTSDTVGRQAIQAFAGSMEGHRARKGVFITTSAFSAEARSYVDKIERRIVLIDGREFARLMIEHDVGVTTAETYRVKRIDSDYFSENDT